MKLTRLNNYLLDKDFKLIYKDNYLNIINYQEIVDFNSNKIIVNCNNKTLSIIGSNLVITKMEDYELLITGNIYTINF